MKWKEKKKGKTYPTASNMPPGIRLLLISLQAEFLLQSFLIISLLFLLLLCFVLFFCYFLIIRRVALGKQRKSVEEMQLELKGNVDEMKGNVDEVIKQIGEVKDILASLKEALKKDDIWLRTKLLKYLLTK